MHVKKITTLAATCCVAWSTTAFAEGTTFSAVVNASGGLVRGAEVQVAKRNSVGNYSVTFKREVAACTFVSGITGIQGGQTSLRLVGTKGLQIFALNKSGVLADAAFNLIASCDAGLPPVLGELVINEVMANPGGPNTDASQEWFELFNPTQKSVNLSGLTVSTASTSQAITCNGAVLPGAFAIFARSADPSANDNLPPVTCVFSLPLVNSGGSLTIKRGTIVIDTVNFTGTTWVDGHAFSLQPSAPDTVTNDNLANWCFSSQFYSGSNYGTPKATNQSCP